MAAWVKLPKICLVYFLLCTKNSQIPSEDSEMCKLIFIISNLIKIAVCT